MRGKRAKQFGQKIKGNSHYDIDVKGVCWNSVFINRHNEEYQVFIRKVYHAMFDQCPRFRETLKAIGTKRLFHIIGNHDPLKTILTETELCDILNELRNEL